MIEKFTKKDRELVVSKLEEIQKTKLIPVKPSRKLFKDDNGLYYVIFGGKNDWHGIRPNLMKQILEYNKEGVFIVVKKFKSKLNICVGSLSTLIYSYKSLIQTQKGDYQFHTFLTEDGLYVTEIPNLYCNLIAEIHYPGFKKNTERLKEISKIINIEVSNDAELTHSDIQAKLILIGSYLGYRTFTPDKSKESVYGVLGELCSESELPTDYLPPKQLDTIKFIDVIWFDEEGFPTHGFEVEHSTDITKGLLRLYQVHKLKIKMFVIAREYKKGKFDKELNKTPFHKIKQEYVFKNYQELDDFFQSVKAFVKVQKSFLNE